MKLYQYQLMRGLGFIHGRGLVHCDLKPPLGFWKLFLKAFRLLFKGFPTVFESQVSALFLEPRIVGTSIDTCQKDECPNALPLAVISESRRVDHAPRIKGWRCLWQLLTRSVTAGTNLLPIFLQKALWTNRLLIISA